MTQKEHVHKVEEALVQAHRNRPEIDPGIDWNRRVMAQVRAEGRLFATNRGAEFAQRFVWRFAAVTCTLALAISLYALQSGIGPEQLALNFFINDPLALQAIPLFTL